MTRDDELADGVLKVLAVLARGHLNMEPAHLYSEAYDRYVEEPYQKAKRARAKAAAT